MGVGVWLGLGLRSGLGCVKEKLKRKEYGGKSRGEMRLDFDSSLGCCSL